MYLGTVFASGYTGSCVLRRRKQKASHNNNSGRQPGKSRKAQPRRCKSS